jgi:chromatin remodeling complex protein RSC6
LLALFTLFFFFFRWFWIFFLFFKWRFNLIKTFNSIQRNIKYKSFSNSFRCFDEIKPPFEDQEKDTEPPKEEKEEGEEEKQEEKQEDENKEGEEGEEGKKKVVKVVEPPLPSPDF